jgi:hypothetical protein
MCVSAPASFLVGAALLPASYFCVKVASRKSMSYVFLAAVPLAFAVQQFSEGFVWIGIDRENPRLTEGASVVYLFFAMAFWPFWVPFSMMFTEPRRRVRLFLAILTATSLAWGWLYAPILMEPERWLSTIVVHHSIQYKYSFLPGYEVAPRWVWRLGYLLLVAVPLGLGATHVRGKTRGLLAFFGLTALVAGFGVSYFVYWYAFISVWCFLAALISLALCYFFARLSVQHNPMNG